MLPPAMIDVLKDHACGPLPKPPTTYLGTQLQWMANKHFKVPAPGRRDIPCCSSPDISFIRVRPAMRPGVVIVLR